VDIQCPIGIKGTNAKVLVGSCRSSGDTGLHRFVHVRDEESECSEKLIVKDELFMEGMMVSEKAKKWLKFLVGFLGWFFVSTVVFALEYKYILQNLDLSRGDFSCVWPIFLMVNLLVLIVLATREKTRWIALGIVSAMAANFLIATALLSFSRAACFYPVTLPQYDPFQSNNLPEGFHDGNEGRVDKSACAAFGWVVDPDDRDVDLTIRILADGNEIAQATANIYRPDLAVPQGCPSGTCAFNVDLWNLISHNTEHSILVQGRDSRTGRWENLGSTPKTLTCTN
jgi:hypothetical protein